MWFKLKSIFNKDEKVSRKLDNIVSKVCSYSESFSNLSNSELQEKTFFLKNRISSGERVSIQFYRSLLQLLERLLTGY